jgi:hypothetical protein
MAAVLQSQERRYRSLLADDCQFRAEAQVPAVLRGKFELHLGPSMIFKGSEMPGWWVWSCVVWG